MYILINLHSDINKIMKFITPIKTPTNPMVRQTLLFSATFTEDVQRIANSYQRPAYEMVDTVGEEVEQTHANVEQSMIVTPLGMSLTDYILHTNISLTYIIPYIYIYVRHMYTLQRTRSMP